MCSYVVDGKLYNISRREIVNPSLCADGDDYIFWGTIEEVIAKYDSLVNGFNSRHVDWSKVSVIPLWKRLSIEDCSFVINVAYKYTGCGFLSELKKVFSTDELYTWLEEQKKQKQI